MRITIEIGDITEDRINKAVDDLERIKDWYGRTAQQQKMSALDLAAKLEPIGDAIAICGRVSLAVAEAAEQSLDDVAEFEAFAGPAAKTVVPRQTKPTPLRATEPAANEDTEPMPLCRFCDQPGTRAGGRKDEFGRVVEKYYECHTKGCIAERTGPLPADAFSGGQ